MRKKKDARSENRVECYVTTREKQMIENEAEKNGLSVSSYVRFKLLGDKK